MMATSSDRDMSACAAVDDLLVGSSGVAGEVALAGLCNEALSHYRVRILSNVDLGRLDSLRDKALVIGRALMEHGDARGFVMARRIMAAAEKL